MRAFIIRPFGIKKNSNGNEINFDAVEEQLVVPALQQLGIDGTTTLEILRQGNIRIDMFQRLLTADLVVADLSIHNANVFYELGIRHALREKRTFLLRCDGDKYPFDLQTDRYFVYKKDDIAASLPGLIEALHQTLNSEYQDSPVFRSLPDLKVQDRSRFLPVPGDFREEAELAAARNDPGDLELLAAEVGGLEWESEGLRVVGRAQFKLKLFASARVTWEAVRKLDGADLEANRLLGTIYQRLGDLARSDQAVKRALERQGLAPDDRAELFSLLGSNAKARWKAEWEAVASDERTRRALRSGHLEDSLQAYTKGFDEDLNHYYSGLNALAMLVIQTELATLSSEVWQANFETAAEAKQNLEQKREQMRRLAAGVELSLRATITRMTKQGKNDVWAEISQADLCFLTSHRPPRVAAAYQKTLAHADEFAKDSMRRQLALYQELGILRDSCDAAISVIAPNTVETLIPAATKKEAQRILLFTGHMIDAPGRKIPRFPPGPEHEVAARQAIENAISEEIKLPGGIAFGMAGGACGGDILFHEGCAKLGIASHLYLALPANQYVVTSVQHGGADWVRRFWELHQRLTQLGFSIRQLAESKELPRWLQEKPDYSIWQRNNLWILSHALAEAGDNVTLIALWNGEKGDGPGGTDDMVQRTMERAARTIILDSKKLFGL